MRHPFRRIPFAGIVVLLISCSAQATITTSFVPVAGQGTGTPYPAAALAADPSLANYATYDLHVQISAGDRWTSASIRTSLDSTGTTQTNIPGTFYAPPTHGAAVDNDTPQQAVYDSSATANFQFDTWVNTILDAPDSDGNYWGSSSLLILGKSDYPTNQTGAAIMPRTADNPSAAGGADVAKHTIDVDWGDPQGNFRSYPLPGDYTIARLTFDSAASGNWIVGQLTHTTDLFTGQNYAYQLPALPEPASLSLIICGAGAVCLRRSRRR